MHGLDTQSFIESKTAVPVTFGRSRSITTKSGSCESIMPSASALSAASRIS